MLNVLHVCATAERGGLEVVLLNIIKSLDRTHFNPHVVFLTDGPFVREVQEAGIQIHVIDAGRVRQLLQGGRAIARLVRLIRAEGIQLVHSHNAKAHIYGGIAAKLAGIPGVYHLHGVPRLALSRDGLVSMLSVVAPARRTVACSSYVAGAFRKAWRTRRAIAVIHNGTIPTTLSQSEAQTVRQELGIPQATPIVLMAARLQRWKGVHVFVDAAAQVAKQRPEARFLIVGGTLFGLEPDYPKQLEHQITRLNLQDRLELVGYRPDVSRFYSAADLVVHCSIEPEPFAMVLLEAMACSKAVIASDCGGTSEIVEHGTTGLLIPPNSPKHLAQAICKLLDDPRQRSQMGQVGFVRVRDYLNAERMTRQVEALYLESATR